MEPDRVAGAGSQAEPEGFDATSARARLIEARCSFAQLSRKEADAAYARVSEAREAYYRQLALVASLTAAANPDAVRPAKEAAHRDFRARVAAAEIRAHVERAATVWLDEINKINRAIQEEQVRMKREREEAARMDAELDRLTATAETSRSMAEAAEAACLAAQQGMGEPDEAPEDAAAGSSAAPSSGAQAAERAALSAPDAVPTPPSEAVAASSAAASPAPTADDASVTPEAPESPEPPESPESPGAPAAHPAPPGSPKVEYGGSRPPTIVRLLRRDRSAMNRLVDGLAGTDIDQRRRWQLLLSTFVDAVVAAAIDSGCLEFPPTSRFWNQFDREQSREVSRGLAALGFRYDGMSQFADGRVPDRRDLSISVGQAGMYSVRVRYWPSPEENADLMLDIRVDTDLLLTEEAPLFTLGEMLQLLGWRAELLADLWNEWSRVRPLLLASSPT